MRDRRAPLVFAVWLAAAAVSSWFAVWSQQGAARHNRAARLLSAPSRWVAAWRQSAGAPGRVPAAPTSSLPPERASPTESVLEMVARVAAALTSQPLAAALPLALGEIQRQLRLDFAQLEWPGGRELGAEMRLPPADAIEFPLGASTEHGRLLVAADHHLSRDDRLALHVIAHMIGLALAADTARHAVPMTPPPADFTESVAEDLAALVEQIGAATNALPTDVDSAQDALRQADGLARLSLAEVRHSVLASLVESVQHRGVINGVRDVLEQLRREFGVYYAFRHNIERPLPPVVEAGVFGIAQNALKLIAEYAQPTEIRLTLDCRDDVVRLILEDDGLDVSEGYPNDQRVGPPGALGMREYAKLLGGAVTLQSRPTGGNRIEAWLPVNAMFVA
ncbi:MAG: hypothetical protein NZ518_02535 [Dehalococcoidia bacterium]|nr:hypothetical protein [Dehalococcoidia bacterium]